MGVEGGLNREQVMGFLGGAQTLIHIILLRDWGEWKSREGASQRMRVPYITLYTFG